MNRKFLFFLSFLLYFSKATFVKGQETNVVDTNLTQLNYEALNEYLSQKAVLRRSEGLGGKLTVSGDITTQWINRHEEFENKVTIDGEEIDTWTVNTFPTVLNVRFRYDNKKTWLSSQLRWKKEGGVPISAIGIVNRAFMGYSLCKNPKTNFYVEAGTSSLGFLFESAVQFGENFSGLHIFCSHSLCNNKGLLTVHGGPFVVNVKNRQYAWVVEGILNQLPGGLLFKYSMIDWHTFRGNNFQNSNQAEHNQKYNFLVCQGLIGCERSFYKIPTYIYAAGLINPRAEATPTTLDKKENKAWYVGGTFGVLRKAHDWSFTLRYEYVQALAIPEDDSSGIGRGTLINAKLYQAIIKKDLPGAADGFTNYKGINFLAMYSLTDSISLRFNVTHSNPVEKKLGNPFKYHTVGLSAVSAF